MKCKNEIFGRSVMCALTGEKVENITDSLSDCSDYEPMVIRPVYKGKDGYGNHVYIGQTNVEPSVTCETSIGYFVTPGAESSVIETDPNCWDVLQLSCSPHGENNLMKLIRMINKECSPKNGRSPFYQGRVWQDDGKRLRLELIDPKIELCYPEISKKIIIKLLEDILCGFHERGE